MLIAETDSGNGAIVRFMEKKLSGQYTFRIPLELEAELERISRFERRKRSDIARFLLERGLVAYKRDGALFEDDALSGKDPKETAASDSGKKEIEYRVS